MAVDSMNEWPHITYKGRRPKKEMSPNKLERRRALKVAEQEAEARRKVRAQARDQARNSDCDRTRRALRLAEGGFGVLHIITATGVDGAFVRRLVLGEVR